MENLTRIYFNYSNGTYITENETVGNNENLDFDTVLTIQRQELAMLAEEGLIDWKQAFEFEGDFVTWNCVVDEWKEIEE